MSLVPRPKKDVVKNSEAVEERHGDRILMTTKLLITGLLARKPEMEIGKEEGYKFPWTGPVKIPSLRRKVRTGQDPGRLRMITMCPQLLHGGHRLANIRLRQMTLVKQLGLSVMILPGRSRRRSGPDAFSCVP